tara:strand:+ start:306 stop:689 length:384 start_codon:yes stop_codon:yes gene_type:complete
MKVKKIHGHGNHLIFDGFSELELNDIEFVKRFLEKTVKKVKMKSISKPLVLEYKAKEKLEGGITGMIILAESNMTLHTYPGKKAFFLDIFSCKEFDIENTMKFLIKELKVVKYKYKFLKRGFYDEKD